MAPLVISFYTLQTPYEEEVKKLIDSCQKYKIEADIVGVASRGSWEKNCAFKPFFILEKMKEWKRPLFWVDADAIFLHEPDFTEFTPFDFSVRVNEFLPSTHPSRIISNAIFVQNKGIEIIEKWCQKAEQELNSHERKIEFWDQIALRDVLIDTPFYPMPLKYAKIFDFDDLFISNEEVIIEHYQASRRLKTQIHAFPFAAQNHCCC